MQLLLRPPQLLQTRLTRGSFDAWHRIQHDVFIDAICLMLFLV